VTRHHLRPDPSFLYPQCDLDANVNFSLRYLHFFRRLPPTARQRETERSRVQRRRLRTGEHRATARTEPPSANQEAWDNYFRDQESRGIVYGRAEPSSSNPPAAALLPRSATSEVGFARPPANFQVLNLQAQHMVIHDSSSGQLVEATVPSIDFSQSVALWNILQSQTSAPQNSPSCAREDSPLGSGQRSHRRWSPSPEYRPHSVSPRRYEDQRRRDRQYESRRYDEWYCQDQQYDERHPRDQGYEGRCQELRRREERQDASGSDPQKSWGATDSPPH
jgi:hypothetical protein